MLEGRSIEYGAFRSWSRCIQTQCRKGKGTHSLECYGGIRDSRYRKGNMYDGIHMYGASGQKAYTESVLKILRNANLIQKNPPKYFRSFHEEMNKSKLENNYFCPTQETDYLNDKDVRRNNFQAVKTSGYTVPTYNRFSGLSQEN